ncbi:MAG: hypothetical protein IPF72_09330 [Chitinophagaceae bacterium]|nr:hypothetical protein [Chitinophagaceae bacterium]
MKTINSIRLILSLFAIAVFILFLNSCKKTNIDMPANQNAEDARAAAIKAIKDKYGNISAGVIINVNRDPKDLFYRNAITGNMVKIDKSSNNNIVCNYNCGNTSNPADLHLVYTLSYIQRNYMCEASTKSDLNVSWTISVPFTPLTTYGLNSSTGTLKVTDPFSTLHTYNNLAITIRTIGADPDCSQNTLYEIKFTASSIPDSYFGSGMTMDASLNLYNNCSIVGNLINTGDVGAADLFLQAELPCYRVDKVWINPPGGGTSYATAFGNYNICSYPSGFALIDNHQLEYRQVTSGSSLEWDDQSSLFIGQNLLEQIHLIQL